MIHSNRASTAAAFILDITPEIAGHLCVAIGTYHREARRSGLQTPPELSDLARRLASRAMSGQRGTPVDDLWEAIHSDPVPKQLVTIEQSATALACSARTIRRLITNGDLPAVYVGPGNTRIRVNDLADYVDSLPGKREGNNEYGS